MEQNRSKSSHTCHLEPEGEPTVQKVEFHPLQSAGGASPKREIHPAFLEVNLKLAAELGKTSIKIRDLIDLEEGSLLKLNQMADESVTMLVNEVPFAMGEIVVINDHFGVRITSFIHGKSE